MQDMSPLKKEERLCFNKNKYRILFDLGILRNMLRISYINVGTRK